MRHISGIDHCGQKLAIQLPGKDQQGTSGPLLIFARELDGQLLTTVVNAADVSQALSLPWSAPPARDLLTGQRFIPTDNAISLTLPPRSGWLLQTDLP